MSRYQPVVALLALFTLPAMASGADDVTALRAELQSLKSDYDARVEKLEARIQQLESASAAAADAAAAMPAPEPAPPPSPASGAGAAAFNPSISVVLGGSYTSAHRDPGDWNIAGFTPAGDEIGPGERSFNLGESEMTIAASVDPYFSAQLTAAITGENEIEVEEAFVRTASLPDGFTAKLGRFFSGLGYLNEVHAHAWDFIDQPLAYQAMFGGQFTQNGVQVKWIAPTDVFLELGAETGNGDSFPGTRRDRNGLNGATLFAHVGGDIGDDTSWRAGASWQETHADDRNLLVDPLLDSFTGDSRTWVADAVLKWAPTPRRQIKLQAEYLRRQERGEFTSDPVSIASPVAYDNTQEGWYVQGVYQFAARWRAGLRYDRLDSGTPDYRPIVVNPADSGALDAAHPQRVSMMLDWNPSEFTRLRAQYDLDDARDEGGLFSKNGDRVLRLQYLFGIGAHGAHKY
ncbi:MAG TPA: outer membrane beta-barrel protein [Steroidobacteraceae bacterium]|nr:outer membrane beta-barrel protein [Steroidobacteraceae bacterium]